MNVLHVVHDFLPRHRAGSEIYAASLAASLATRHHVTVLCAEYDPTRAHGHVTWRVFEGLPVVEIVNNWVGRSFEDSYRPALITQRIEQVLQAVQPDVVHVHNLFNLSFELPALARARGIPVVATLHDYTLVCPSGGQRVHRADAHVCASIDTTRCARCFKESPFYSQLSVGAIAAAAPGGWVRRLAVSARRRFPTSARLAAVAAPHVAMVAVTPEAIDTRLARARQVFDEVDLFVAPSAFMADEFVRLGVDRARMQVSANGQMPMTPIAVTRPRMPLRIGFVGTIVWHKGVHVLVNAVRALPASGYELRIFGGWDVAPDYVADLRARAVGLPVRFEGAFAPAQVPEVFAELDVLVVPSLWPENAPLVIQEAFQAGVPVVGARMGGIPEFIREGVTGRLFDPRASGQLTRILGDLIEHPAQLSAMAAARPPVKSIEDDACEWEDRYREVIARRDAVSATEQAS
ncbi:MAG TPA: glycosyltransferase family 4 protein [Vicinamibacterales bacterium]